MVGADNNSKEGTYLQRKGNPMKEIRSYVDPLHISRKLKTGSGEFIYFSLNELARNFKWDMSQMPITLKILLESIVRNMDGHLITEEDVKNMGALNRGGNKEIPFMPARVIMQDFTGVPAIVDLAVMRDAISDL